MTHLRIFLIAAIAAGCSVPSRQPLPPPTRVMPIADTFEFHSQPYLGQESGTEHKAPQFCHLGRDCMELDSRPFTPCLVDGEPCEGEGGFMKAAPDVIIKNVAPADIGPLPDSSSRK